MWIGRVVVLIIAVIAYCIASSDSSGAQAIMTMVENAWAGFGAAFGPLMIFSLFWKRTNKWGALAGMLSGGIMVFVWKYAVRPLGGAWNIYELLPAFVVSANKSKSLAIVSGISG